MTAGAAPWGAGTDARIEPIGDAAVLLTLGEPVDPDLAALAQAIAAAVDEVRPAEPALGRAVPAHASVLVPFDPLGIELAEVIRVVEACSRVSLRPAGEAGARAPIEIPVRYGDADGPDLDEIAALHDLRPVDVIELHSGASYRVLFLGFAPGFAYLGGLPPELVTPRKATPRARVPAGSVGIAGEQTGVYPLGMPGGWQLIGRTEMSLWDATLPSPAFLRPGDRVRFVPAR